MTQELFKLINENFEYNTTNLHTAFPGIVKSYDSETRRAEIQPSLKRKLSTGEFLEFPILVDVPVVYFGTVKGGIHIPLEENDEVLVLCSERCIDMWKDNGGSEIEDVDIRRFNLSDAIAIPGLQATTFPQIEDTEGFSFHHDTKLVFTTEKTTITIEEDKLTFDNGNESIEFQAPGILIKDGNDNQFELSDSGMNLTDANGNKVEMTSSGMNLTDANGNKVEMTSSGMNLTDANGGKIQMGGKITLQGMSGKIEIT